MRTTHTVSISQFFFNDTATTEIYTLSLHDALPICLLLQLFLLAKHRPFLRKLDVVDRYVDLRDPQADQVLRSEEHTSELQSRQYLVCRLLLEKKKLIPHLLLPFTPLSIILSPSFHP